VRDETIYDVFDVLAPSGIDHANFEGYYPYSSTTQAGAGVHLRPIMKPTGVSFYNVQVMEIGQPASGASGYFLQPGNTPPPHDTAHKANAWIDLDCDNSWKGDYDWATSYDWSPPWSSVSAGFSGGSYTWVIPAKYRVKGKTAEWSIAAGWNQVHTLSANGTMTVQKFGHSVSRTINNVYSGQ
jgi:hypothetical protein